MTAPFSHHPYFILSTKQTGILFLFAVTSFLVVGNSSRLKKMSIFSFVLLGLLATTLVTYGINHSGWLPDERFLLLISFVFLFFLARHNLSDQISHVEIGVAMTVPLLLVSGFYLLQLIFQSPLGTTGGKAVEGSSTFLNRNYLASYLAFGFSFPVFLLCTEVQKRTKCLAIMTLLLAGTALGLSGSESTLIAAFLALIITVFCLFVRESYVKISSTCIILLLLGIPSLLFMTVNARPNLFYRTAEVLGVRERSVSDRLLSWKVGIQTIRNEGMMIGIGPGNYQHRRKQHQHSVLRQERFHRISSVPRTLHNDYLTFLVELGIPGLLLFLFLIGCTIYQSLSACKVLRGEKQYFALAFLFSCMTTILHAWLHNAFFDPLVGSQFFLLLGLFSATVQTDQRLSEDTWFRKFLTGSGSRYWIPILTGGISVLLLVVQVPAFISYYWFERADHQFRKARNTKSNSDRLKVLNRSYRSYQLALQSNPDLHEARLNFLDVLRDHTWKTVNHETAGVFASDTDRFRQQFRMHTRILREKIPDDPMLYMKLATYKRQELTNSGSSHPKNWSKEDVKQVKNLYKKALKRNPNLVSALRKLAELCSLDSSFYPEAIGYLKSGIKRAPRNARLRFHLVALYREEGKRRKAIHVLENFLKNYQLGKHVRQTAQIKLRTLRKEIREGQ